jgi:hypothetical protein
MARIPVPPNSSYFMDAFAQRLFSRLREAERYQYRVTAAVARLEGTVHDGERHRTRVHGY